MSEVVNKVVQQLGVSKLLLMLAISISMIIGFTMVSVKMAEPNMQLLYGGLEPKEASLIVDKLAAAGIKYDVKGESHIYVPEDKVGELRLKIAGEGLVGNSIKGYEIFEESSSFGTTSLVQNINSRRALEGELARTIMSLPAVNNARVHLVIPKKRLFLKEKTKPTASVVINVGSRVLEQEQINSISHMVASSVPGLSAEDVSIIDNRGKLLSAGDGQTDMTKLSTAETYKNKIEGKYQNQLTNMLETILGVGKVNVKVSAEIDMDRFEETAELYDPKNQVVRSEQVSEEANNSSNGYVGSPTGTESNLNSDDISYSKNGSATNQTKSQETINYEISKTIRHSIKQAGELEKLSVAVVLEGNYQTAEDGTKTYIPLTESQLNKFKVLIKSAIGYDETRGDVVEVVDLPFSEVEQLEETKEPLFNRQDIVKIVEYAMILIGFVVMVMFVIKPILSTTHTVVQAKMPKLEPIIHAAPSAVTNITEEQPDEEEAMLIDISNVEGKVREASIKKAAHIIENHPEESTQVIRRWMLGDLPTENN